MDADREVKSVPFALSELKARADGWEIAGYASTWGGEPDSYGDIVARGAFADSIAKRSPKFFYQHFDPIGKTLAIEEDDKGLFGRWSIFDTTQGSDAYKLAKGGALDSLSIGFRTVEADFREDGVRVLRKVDLFEVSLVAIPANDNALITQVKSDLPTDELLRRATYSLSVAVREAKALHERRAADGRKPNDRFSEATDALLAAVRAAEEQLRGLPASDAKATTRHAPSINLLAARLSRLGIHVEGIAQ